MPTYQYACTECGHRFEAVQSITDDSLATCPVCSGQLRKVYGSVGVVFKGSGFYNTDYGTSKRKRELEKSASDGADKNDAKQKDKQEKKAETKSDSKPASSTPSGTS